MNALTAALLALTSTHAFAGFAPDTIGNKVLRATLFSLPTRSNTQMTIILGADGHYNYLVFASYGYLSIGEGVYTFGLPPGPGVGEYTCTL